MVNFIQNPWLADRPNFGTKELRRLVYEAQSENSQEQRAYDEVTASGELESILSVWENATIRILSWLRTIPWCGLVIGAYSSDESEICFMNSWENPTS
jgi:hypothetical protein